MWGTHPSRDRIAFDEDRLLFYLSPCTISPAKERFVTGDVEKVSIAGIVVALQEARNLAPRVAQPPPGRADATN